MQKLSASEAIKKLQSVIETRDKKEIQNLLFMEENNLVTEWENQPSKVFDKWDKLTDQAMEYLFFMV